MKSRNVHYSAASALIVAVLAITAFARGAWKTWLLLGAFLLWGIYMVIALLSSKIHFVNLKAIRRKVQRIKKEKSMTARASAHSSEEPIFADYLLLQHVSYRILDYLHKLYPDAKWEWTSENANKIIRAGGTARIRLFDVPEYNFAEIIFDQQGNMNCEFLSIVPFSQLNGTEQDAGEEGSSVDPAVWYDLQGRRILDDLIRTLKSHGHKQLIIRENGNICIEQENSEVVKDTFRNFPSKSCWSGIAGIMKKNGLSATAEKGGILVTW